MKLISITPLYDYKKYRYEAEFDDGTKTKFGSIHYDNYIMHGDKHRRYLYRQRHNKDLLTEDPRRAGYLSYFILWGDHRSLEKNIEDYKRMFDL